MTQLPQVLPNGEPLTREAALAYLNKKAELSDGLPPSTHQTIDLAGIPSNLGPWYRLTRVYGPKVLVEGQGETCALELVRDNVRFVVYCSGQMAQFLEFDMAEAIGLQKMLDIPIWFRYCWNEYADPAAHKGRKGFYSCMYRVQDEKPTE